jgi:hypothetical protein
MDMYTVSDPINLIAVPPFPIPGLKRKDQEKQKEKDQKLKFHANSCSFTLKP